MKIINKISIISGVILSGILILICIASCGKNETFDPVAYFTYETDGMNVVFTDGSLDASTYSWDFGDGTNSSEQNPSHTYSTGGKYTVTLNVAGKGGHDSASKNVSLTIPGKITIDGDFSDWDQITALVACDKDSGTPSLEIFKIYADDNNIYFYLKMASGYTDGVLDMMLDTDFDSTTGNHSWMWDAGCGVDYLIEGEIFSDKDAAMYKYTGQDGSGDWSWEEVVAAGSNLINAADPVTSDGTTKFEFSIPKELIINLSSTGIGVGLNLMNSSWSSVGILPSPEGGYTTADYNFANESLTVNL
ncbi:MAG: PKD domain-containing protein [Bacteroidales bacterium]|jgi:hypothetical protein|nr:PKD domain-containing protein [Bacteroidales bacterium]